MADVVPSVQTIALEELANILEPLQALASPEGVTTILRELGWNFPASSPFPWSLATVVTDLENLANALYALDAASNESEQVERAAALLAQVASLVASLAELPAQMQGALSAYADFRDHSGLETDFVPRLVDYLVVRYLTANHSGFHDIALLLGLIEYVEVPAEPARYRLVTRVRRVAWQRLPRLFSDPLGVTEDVYRWQSSFDDELFLARLLVVATNFGLFGNILEQDPRVRAVLGRQPDDKNELRLPFLRSGNFPHAYVEGGLRFSAAPAQGNAQRGLAIFPYLVGAAGTRTELTSGFQVEFASSVALENGVVFMLRPPHDVAMLSNLLTSPIVPDTLSFTLKVARMPQPGEVLILLGSPGRSRVTANDIGVAILARKTGDDLEVAVEAGMTEASIVVAPGDGDGFLQKILPADGVRTNFGFIFGWSNIRGLYFSGGAGLEVTLPVHTSILGVLTVDSIYLALRAQDNSIRGVVAATTSIQLGPITAVVEQFGLAARLAFPPSGGNLGPADLALTFKPPNGAALAVDAGAVVGGGYLFFDHEKEQYAGILQLEINGTINLKAIGLLTTRMPDGSRGFSLLVIIVAEGFPPIQLGFGFTLTSVGGLLGINRTVMVDVLRAGIRTGTLNSILFPQDPIRNAPQIISDLSAVFPPTPNQYVFGPMAIIGWGTPTILTIELGLVLEFPSPLRLLILGRLRAALPDREHALVYIQMDALGVIDFDRREASLDATLYDSRLLQFVLTGDMALRASWGANPIFILAIGGFNPRFAPPAGFPRLERLALNLATGDNPRLRLESYLALTSNTVQFGARVDFYAAAEGFSLEGYLGFDALIHFSPFQFIADIVAGVALKRGTRVLMSVTLDMTLSGPTPWHVRGKASFRVLFLSITVSFDKKFGADERPPLPAPVDVQGLLLEALQKQGNWSAQLPDGGHMLVTLREPAPSPEVFVHPLGQLTVQQRVVPLNLQLAKYGNTAPSGARRFTISAVRLNAVAAECTFVKDYFAPAEFVQMSDDAKLSRPSFELMDAGVRVGTTQIGHGSVQAADIEYEEIVVDPDLEAVAPAGVRTVVEERTTYRMPADALDVQVGYGAAGVAALRRTGPDKYQAGGVGIMVRDTAYVVATRAEAAVRAVGEIARMDGLSYTAMAEALEEHLRVHPEERGRLQVVAGLEGVER